MSTSGGKDSVDHDKLATLGARFKFIACPQGEEKTVDHDKLTSQELDSSLWHVHERRERQC